MLYQENREKDRWQSLIDRSASSENRRRWKGRVRTTFLRTITHHEARTPPVQNLRPCAFRRPAQIF